MQRAASEKSQRIVNGRARILWVAAPAVLVLVGTVIIWILFLGEPTHEGKKLSEWIRNYDVEANREERQRTDKAIRQTGGPAARWLVRALQTKESKFRLWLIRLLGKQSVIRLNVAPVNVDERRWQAAYGLLALGPSAEPALPDLMQAMSNTDPVVRCYAINSIAAIRHNATSAVPALIARLRDDQHSVRLAALCALGKIGPAARDAVAVVISALKDNDVSVRWCAATRWTQGAERCAGLDSRVGLR